MVTVNSPVILIAGLLCGYISLGVLVALSLKSRRTVPLDRRRPQSSSESTWTKLTDSAVGAINKSLKGHQLRFITTDKFEQAGLKIRAGDFVLMCTAGCLVGGLVGFMLAGLGIAILVGLAIPALMVIWLNVTISRRQNKFAQQLPDTLQMLSGSMRAGHSLLRAVDGAADEAEAPMGEELRRVVNETRIGRDLAESLLETASRMKSQDFLWSAQAIETQREVGGNLAEVLENVNETIRERAALARQVRALSAEGRMSAGVLLGLPVVMLILLCFMNPTYASTFFTTVQGWLLLGVAAVMLSVGAFWLSRIIKAKY
jgi:tight adherence protein B